MADVFYELLSIKEPQTVSQNKETTAQSYRKMLNQNNLGKYFMTYAHLKLNLPLPPCEPGCFSLDPSSPERTYFIDDHIINSMRTYKIKFPREKPAPTNILRICLSRNDFMLFCDKKVDLAICFPTKKKQL